MAVMTAPAPQQQSSSRKRQLAKSDVRASNGVVASTRPRPRGRPKGSGGGKRSQATDAVSDFVRTIEPKRLLEHAEEIQVRRATEPGRTARLNVPLLCAASLAAPPR